MDSVAISPDGRNLAWIEGKDNRRNVMTLRLDDPTAKPLPALSSNEKWFSIDWCRWAKNERLLCAVGGIDEPPLIAVSPNGSNRQVFDRGARVAAWLPENPSEIILARGASLYSWNVNTGAQRTRDGARGKMTVPIVDAEGRPHFAYGTNREDARTYYYEKDRDRVWQESFRVPALACTDRLRPVAVDADGDTLALGNLDSRNVLWRVDPATSKHTLLDWGGRVDATHLLLDANHKLLGVRYDDGKPIIRYVDAQLAATMLKVNAQLPQSFNQPTSSSRDGRLIVVIAHSDIDAGSYYLYDSATEQLRLMGRAFPDLDHELLGRMHAINYRAKDGTSIPGYLTLPPGSVRTQLPLVILPHSNSRDYWGFDVFVQFLASRGYAVLQMNHRGSNGYGCEWDQAAHREFGGVAYSDILDGVAWAMEQHLADPSRICMLGWGLGGYQALLGAVRNSDLFKCSISIGGLSDLVQLKTYADHSSYAGLLREVLGRDDNKIRSVSPLQQARAIQIPILLIDAYGAEESAKMAAALKASHKTYRAVFLENSEDARIRDLTTILTELETFLGENIKKSR
jgi:dipeptidyl aminopeptidase/acylaminoacyl peptidase